jgi:hypothetical protein
MGGSTGVTATGRTGHQGTAHDSAGSLSTGLIDTVIYLPTVDDQATLDAAAAAALAKIQASRSSSTDAINSDQMMENITLEVIDENPTGVYDPEDQVTVTSGTLGCSGLYRVKRIERDMTDPNYAKLDMTTRHTEYWQLDEDMRRTVRNLNVLA